jgi:hypothetical protein
MIKLIDLLEGNLEVKNLNYYQQILDKSNNISSSQRMYLQKILDSIKKQNNLATPRQFDILNRIKTGNFKYHSKN